MEKGLLAIKILKFSYSSSYGEYLLTFELIYHYTNDFQNNKYNLMTDKKEKLKKKNIIKGAVL